MKKFILFLSAVLSACTLSFAQEAEKTFDCIKIHNKQGLPTYIPLNQVSNIDFVKVPYLEWEQGSIIPDTITLEAGIGSGIFNYYVDANYPISYTASADWLDVIKHDMYKSYKTIQDYGKSYLDCRSYSQYFLAIVGRNETGSDRYGTMTLSLPSGESLSYTVHQKAYDLKFLDYFEDENRYTEYTTTNLAFDTIAEVYTTVNFGMTVTCPEWAGVKWMTNYNDLTLNDATDDLNIGYISLFLQPNTSMEERAGDVIISGGGQTITWHVKQEGIKESLFAELQQLYNSLTASDLASTSRHSDIGLPGYMVATSEILGDMYPGGSYGYDWFSTYGECQYMGETSRESMIPWYTFYSYIDMANSLISKANSIESTASEISMAVKYACLMLRAYCYYTLMTLYEPIDNIYTDCSAVIGLTVPIVTEATTEEQKSSNPRATHDEMVSFILSDLSRADSCLSSVSTSRSSLQEIINANYNASIHGLRARVYLWDKKYGSATSEARTVINSAFSAPMSKDLWLDAITGFNSANSSWLWCIRYPQENASGIMNFTGWMSNEADWGYSALTQPVIDRSLYERISDTDFRKYSFIDTLITDYPYWNYSSVRGEDWISGNAIPYMSMKFRCNGGDCFNSEAGAMVNIPLMRIEEMYLIEAEGTGVTKGLDAGIEKLEAFVRQYRDPEYRCKATTIREFQLECMWQKRIEFWGEGTAFPDAKRLEAGVMQYYEGSNAPESYRINAQGIKPNWNFVIPSSAIKADSALINNPDPSDCIPYSNVEKGKYYPALH